MKKLLLVMFVSGMFAFGQGHVYEVTIQNLTKSQIFAPPAVVVHGDDWHMFYLGQAASDAVATMAEDGDASGIVADAEAAGAIWAAVGGSDVLMPGATMTVDVPVAFGEHYISIAGMLVTTNDAFYAVSGVRVPGIRFKNRSVFYTTQYADAYDAGSEFNSESCEHIPGPPCGNPGNRVTEGAEGFVHISNGIHGVGDVSSAAYDWRGPVAKISIELVNRGGDDSDEGDDSDDSDTEAVKFQRTRQ